MTYTHVFLKEISAEISKPLTLIMERSLDENVVSEEWRTANVSPVYKKSSCGRWTTTDQLV